MMLILYRECPVSFGRISSLTALGASAAIVKRTTRRQGGAFRGVRGKNFKQRLRQEHCGKMTRPFHHCLWVGPYPSHRSPGLSEYGDGDLLRRYGAWRGQAAAVCGEGWPKKGPGGAITPRSDGGSWVCGARGRFCPCGGGLPRLPPVDGIKAHWYSGAG